MRCDGRRAQRAPRTIYVAPSLVLHVLLYRWHHEEERRTIGICPPFSTSECVEESQPLNLPFRTILGLHRHCSPRVTVVTVDFNLPRAHVQRETRPRPPSTIYFHQRALLLMCLVETDTWLRGEDRLRLTEQQIASAHPTTLKKKE